MNTLPLSLALLAGAATAQAADLPAFEVGCPNDIHVRAEAGGPVHINDKPATLSKFSEQYYEARGAGVTISISLANDGSPSVTYTGKGGANGLCQRSEPEIAPQQ